MKIIDLTSEHETRFFRCLSQELIEEWECGVPCKKAWYEEHSKKGAKVKIALNENDEPVGMIQYVPAELGLENAAGCYFVHCIWIYRTKKIKNQNKGYGKALLAACEEDVKQMGANGLIVWGITLPVFMRAVWFKKRGYRQVDKNGIAVLLWKPFKDNLPTPEWIKQKKTPQAVPGKVKVTVFVGGWCMLQNAHASMAARAAKELGNKVVYEEINTAEQSALSEWGISDGVYINNKLITNGPPLTFEKMKKKIAKYVKKIN